MAENMATGEWQQLDNMWYRMRTIVPAMKWNNSAILSESMYCASSFGGPIAILTLNRDVKKHLEFYTAMGTSVESVEWSFGIPILMSWSRDEILICVFQDSIIRTFSAKGEMLNFFVIDSKVKSEGGILNATIFEYGIAVMTLDHKIYVNFSFVKPQFAEFCSTGLKDLQDNVMCISMVVNSVGHEYSENPNNVHNAIHLLIAFEREGVFTSTKLHCSKLNIESGTYCAISQSVGRRFVAMYALEGLLRVCETTNLEKSLEIAELNCKLKPKQLTWCGEDCVALYFHIPSKTGEIQHTLYLGGPNGAWLPKTYPSNILLIPEIDEVRIVTSTYIESMHNVQKATESVFLLGSSHSAAMLMYTYEKYVKNKISASEAVQCFEEDMESACSTCVAAAIDEWESKIVTKLLKAAIFGYSLSSQYKNNDALISICRDSRICFGVRDSPAEITLTVRQLRYISILTLISRISKLGHHLLAFRICEYVGIMPSGVLVEWASDQIRIAHNVPDDVLAKNIIEKFSICPVISYYDAAWVAATAGRINLATILLEHEHNFKLQVRMLSKLADYRKALRKAELSSNPDLAYEVMRAIFVALDEKSLDEQTRELSALIPIRSKACKIFINFCKATRQMDMLEKFYRFSQDFHSCAWLKIQLAYSVVDHKSMVNYLTDASDLFEKHTNDKKVLSIACHNAVSDEIILRNKIYEWDVLNKLNPDCDNNSVNNVSIMTTVRILILRGLFSEAESLKNTFNIPDAKFWHAKITALADGAHFDELLTFATHRTSPVGLEPFIEACMRNNAVDVASEILKIEKNSNKRNSLKIFIDNYF